MLVVTRYRVPAADGQDFMAQARPALTALRSRPGCRTARLGRAVDDPVLWVLQSEWDDVGSYRRALSSYDVKLHAVPLLSRCLDEPTAFEVLLDAHADEVVEYRTARAEE